MCHPHGRTLVNRNLHVYHILPQLDTNPMISLSLVRTRLSPFLFRTLLIHNRVGSMYLTEDTSIDR